MFKALFGRKSAKNDPHVLYGMVVARAREAELYSRFGVPDTIDGRFEMMAMHVYLVLRYLKRDGNRYADFSQTLFDTFIDDISAGLREAGVGDQTVPKRLQKMSRVFYGRVKAWDEGFDSNVPFERLNQTLGKNLYPDGNAPENMNQLTTYFISEHDQLMAMDATDVVAGKKVFEGSISIDSENPNA